MRSLFTQGRHTETHTSHAHCGGDFQEVVPVQIQHFQRLHFKQRRRNGLQHVVVQQELCHQMQPADGVWEVNHVIQVQLHQGKGPHPAHVLRQTLKTILRQVEVREVGEGGKVGGEGLQSVLCHIENCEIA